ncbi:MAG TPA: hypothetical protein VNY36_08085 [Bacteroidia bacterium]|nr:hypothetical protein [Bacteroidia bacterium]
MNMKNSNRLRLILPGLCILFSVLQVSAQGMLSTFNSYYSAGRHVSYKRFLGHYSFNANECLKYYYNPDDTTQATFKQVIIITYIAEDSTLKNKTFASKEIQEFDKQGQERFSETIDSTGVHDSLRYFYDAHNHEMRSYSYQRDDSGRIKKVSEEIWVYNADGNVVFDSTYNDYGSKYEALDGPGGGFGQVMKYKYNDQGDNVETDILTGWDTSKIYSKYVMHKRVYTKNTGKNSSGEAYMSYNMVGNLTGYKMTNISYMDTSVISTEFDDTGRMVKYIKTDNGKLSNIDTIHINDDGTYTEVDDRITTSYSPTVCPNDSRTVTLFDKKGNILSVVNTQLKNGKPFTQTVRHSYTFSKGQIVLDSCKTVDQGYLFASSSTTIKRYMFDSHGNKIEEDAEGGGQYAKSGSETWKYNGHNKLLAHNTYNSCNADIPESSIMNIYYPGGLKILEVIENRGKYSGKTQTYYTEDSKIQEEVKNEYGVYSLTLYEYKK